MKGCLVILRSVTYAQRAKRVLEKAGLSAYVIKPEAYLVGNGCGFAIKVSDGYLPEAVEVLRENNFDIGKIYIAENGGYRELKL